VALHEKYQSGIGPSSGFVDWQRQLPTLSNGRVTLRELRPADASPLVRQMADNEVRRHIAPPPSTADEFRKFIRWARIERRKGIHITYGVLAPGEDVAVGIFQLWRVEPDFSTAEWGLAVGSRYWGTGIAEAASKLLLEFAFGTLGVQRLEARAGVDNVRGNGLLRKLGAVPEGRLRQAFRHGDVVEDQRLWSLLAEDWTGQVHVPLADF
jgi:RimJ/RimL family protein N-acetyltransferase